MSEEANEMQEQRSDVVAIAHEFRATRARLVAEARAQRRVARGLRDRALAGRERHLEVSWRLWSLGTLPEPPSVIPLSWSLGSEPGPELDAAFAAAEECARVSAAALSRLHDAERRTLAAISGVCRFVADCADASHSDARMALGLCVRVIESNAAMLDRIGRTEGGTLAASAARRCASQCARALTVSYLDVED
jgi:hypothetical protein